MDSTWITPPSQHNSKLLVFINVWLQQPGLPIPSVPTFGYGVL